MPAQTAFDVAAVLVALTALFGYINHRLLRLPQSIGLVLIALVTSLTLLALDRVEPSLGVHAALRAMVSRVDFAHALMDGALSFLLFAGALQINLDELLARKWTILVLATAGVMLSTALIGFTLWGAFAALGLGVSLIYCLVFGALISPTDPVAVLDLLRGVNFPRGLQAIIAGEALFNDGIGIVLFSILLAAATSGAVPLGPLDAFVDFLRAAGGAVLLGLATGYLAFLMMRSIDEYSLELMITVALVMGTYAVAEVIRVSGPVSVVVAGLLTGSHGRRYAMSQRTQEAVQRFWSFVDETLNALLFLLIGFEVVAIEFARDALLSAAVAIPVAVIVRCISVAVPAIPLNFNAPHKGAGIAVLTWAGLRGGVSIALALLLPPGRPSELLLTACYAVVVFTIVVQGLTMRPLARLLFASAGSAKAAD